MSRDKILSHTQIVPSQSSVTYTYRKTDKAGHSDVVEKVVMDWPIVVGSNDNINLSTVREFSGHFIMGSNVFNALSLDDLWSMLQTNEQGCFIMQILDL